MQEKSAGVWEICPDRQNVHLQDGWVTHLSARFLHQLLVGANSYTTPINKPKDVNSLQNAAVKELESGLCALTATEPVDDAT